MKGENLAVSGIQIPRAMPRAFDRVLAGAALDFVAHLARRFEGRRRELMQLRAARQTEFDRGVKPDFLPHTRGIRAGDWTVAPIPADLQDRRVEITGPVDRKMIINALNSGASAFLADFEDSNTPTWENVVRGQVNLHDAVDRCISLTSPDGKHYALAEKTATLFVRPRGLHMLERHALLDGEPVAASLFDFGLFFFHNAATLLGAGSGPYFYLPKLESSLEARWWNDVFAEAEASLGFPRGSIRATVLIETLPAAFEMDEILWELKEHSAGLNCGRWDYIFSCIKKFRGDREVVFADRSAVTMTSPFLRAYCQLLVKTCHRRNAHAMGGMAAQIPIKGDRAANDAAIGKVRADKEREVADGFDGTWVAHPGLVPVAKAVFDAAMPTPNQIHRKRADVSVAAADLLAFGPQAPVTEAGLRTNINVGLQYLGAWLEGNGCVPINHLMEDAATAEISRSQIWQWIRSPKGVLDDGRKVTLELFRKLLPEELARIGGATAGSPRAESYDTAARLLDRLVASDAFVDFLTEPAYEHVAGILPPPDRAD